MRSVVTTASTLVPLTSPVKNWFGPIGAGSTAAFAVPASTATATVPVGRTPQFAPLSCAL
jgi:hypothetical protein